MNFVKSIRPITSRIFNFAFHKYFSKPFHTSHWRYGNNAALQQVLNNVNDELQAIRNAGTWKHERIITTKQGEFQQVPLPESSLGTSVRVYKPICWRIFFYVALRVRVQEIMFEFCQVKLQANPGLTW